MTVELDPGESAQSERESSRLRLPDLLKTGPGTLAGRYLRSFWQAVGLSSDIAPGHAKPIRIMGEDLTLYRGSGGAVHIVEPYCAHRGALLSQAWVEGDDLRCVYHGWKYDATGQCIDQPAEPRPFCSKVRIRSYPAREYLGIVFVYMGDSEPPPFERIPDFEDYQEYPYYLSVDVWPCSYYAQLENSLDYAHTEFLHWHFHYKTPELVCTETEYGIKVTASGLTGTPSFYDTGYFHMPVAHEWVGPPDRGEKVGHYARGWRIPQDDNSHLRINLMVWPVKGRAGEQFRARRQERMAELAKQGQNPSSWQGRSVPQFARDVVQGRLEMRVLKDEAATMADTYLINAQDCSVMAGLSLTRPDHREQLGRADVGIILLRRIWLQELRNFARGEPTKRWKRPDFFYNEVREAFAEAAA